MDLATQGRREALQVERLYWSGLRDEAQSRGTSGESFQRCIDSIDVEIWKLGEATR